MVCVRGLDSKSYEKQVAPGKPIPEVPCPSCNGCRLRGHGWHKRYLGGQRVALRRLRCPRCRVSHVLLPEDVCAYRDLTLETLEVAMEAPSVSAAARAAGQVGVAAVRQARRWRRGSTWRYLSFLLPAAGTAWQRIEAIVGKVAGKLLRLRRWLWSHLGTLLGGPTGLFRDGRPRSRLEGGSP